MKTGIVVIGTTFVDIKGYPVTKYIPGGRNAGRVVRVHGGVSRNVAEDIANIELRPTFVTAVEDDGVGTEVVEKLKRHKVNTEYIRRMPDGMGTWLAIFDNSGDVVASISRRPDTSILLRILEEQGDEIVSRADAIAVEVDVEDSLLNKIFRLAEKYDKRVYGLVSNMTIAVEPMINAGSWEVRTLKDGWTVVTADGKLSAHYENSLLITDGEPEILTMADDL